MVCSHRCGPEEGKKKTLFPQAPEEIWNESPHPPLILHLHCGKHPDWLHYCLVWKQHQQQSQSSAKGCVNCLPHCRRWASLPPGHLHQAVHEETRRIISDSSHPSHGLFSLLPSGRRLRSIRTRTSRLRDSFFPQTIRLLNTLNCTQHTSLSIPFTFNSTTTTFFFTKWTSM